MKPRGKPWSNMRRLKIKQNEVVYELININVIKENRGN